MDIAPFDFHSMATWLRVGVAAVWLVFGLVFKAFDVVPRHRQIVARVLGERVAPWLTKAVGAGETVVGLWMLSGRLLWLCVALQTGVIVVMNTLELRYARDLLLSPLGMIAANAVLLSVGWYVALV
jgi:DoxX-like family